MLRNTIRYVVATAAFAGMLIGASGCSDPVTSSATARSHAYRFLPAPQLPALSRSGSDGSAVIGPDGGTVRAPGGFQIVFPAGALAEPTTIRIRPSSVYDGVELEPHGITFPAGHQPVLTLPYDSRSVRGTAPLSVVYVVDGAVVETLATGVSGGTLTTKLPHFSLYMGAQG